MPEPDKCACQMHSRMIHSISGFGQGTGEADYHTYFCCVRGTTVIAYRPGRL